MDSEFVRELRDALAHLYDHAYLETHPLAEKIVANRVGMARTRAQETRRILLDAIELLNPGDNIPLRAPERRAYEVLFGLYVEGRDADEVADSLGIGERQLRRDRATAAEALATIVQDRYLLPADKAQTAPTGATSPDPHAANQAVRAQSLDRESRQLAHHAEVVELGDFFAKLLPLLQGLAQQHGVELVVELAPTLPPLPLSYPLLRQIVLSLASQSIHHLPLHEIRFLAEVTPQRTGIGLALTYRPGQAPARAEAERTIMKDDAVNTMLEALGGKILWETKGPDQHRLWILLPRRTTLTLLVVDDKQDLFELFLRYLTGHPYQLCHAADARTGLQTVRDVAPDIILLDLMMPDHDGWEFLQALRADPTLPPMPVIVCSVLHEPELAFSLGAQAYLKKPVAADELVQALEQVRGQVWAAETHPTAPVPDQAHAAC